MMTLRRYAPKDSDRQTPHDQDELYIVAGDTHRFEDFSPDFATWVVFYRAVGGESP